MSKKANQNQAAKPAAKDANQAAQPAAKPLVDVSKLSIKALQSALKDETSMQPAVALAYREELEKREKAEAAKPEAKPEAKKPAAKPAAKDAKKPAAQGALELHLNNTGRLCFLRDAAERLEQAGFPIDAEYFMVIAIDEKSRLVRLEPTSKALDGALEVRAGAGRPYISATKRLKPLGFAPEQGAAGIPIEAKPYGKAGFEFRLPRLA